MKPIISPAEFSANVRRRFYSRAAHELRAAMDSVFNYREVVARDGQLGVLFGPFVVAFHETIEADYLNRVVRRLASVLNESGWYTQCEDNAISACSIPFDSIDDADNGEGDEGDDEPSAPYDPASAFLRRMNIPLQSDSDGMESAEVDLDSPMFHGQEAKSATEKPRDYYEGDDEEGEEGEEGEGEAVDFVFEPEDDADSFFAESEGDDSEGDDSEGDDSEGDDSEGDDSEGDDSEGDDSEGDDSEGENLAQSEGAFTFDDSDVYNQARMALEAFAESILERDPNIAVELSNPDDDDNGTPSIDVLLPQGDIVQYTVDLRALAHAMRSGSTKATLMSDGIAFFSYKVALSKLFARIEQSE